MKEQVKVTTFLTELDAILDTRMGTILRINSDSPEEVFANGYFDRDRDVFKSIDREQFKELYAKRDKLTLKASMMTPMMGFLRSFCKETYETNIKTPFLSEPKIVINTYPYDLNEEELSMLLSAIQTRIGSLTPVTSVRMEYKKITPNYLKRDTAIAAFYNVFEWLEEMSKGEEKAVFKRESCPLVTLMGPRIFTNLDCDLNLEEFAVATETLGKPWVNLELMDIKLFSADIPLNNIPTKKKTESQPV